MAKETTNASPPAKSSLMGSLLGNKLRLALVGGGAVLLFGLVVGGYLLMQPSHPPIDPYKAALAAIDAGEYTQARVYATQLYSLPLSYERSGAPFYVLGAASALEAEANLDPKYRGELQVLAAHYLEEAHQLGFPPGHEVAGTILLAQQLFHMGEYARCLPILNQLLANASQPLPAAERLLAGAYLRDAQPNYLLALTHLERYLATPNLSAEEQQSGQLEQARILMGLKRFAEANQLLQGVDSSEHETQRLLLEGQLALAEASESNPPEEEAYSRALTLLQSAIDRDVTNLQVTAPAEYLMGVAYREAADPETALTYFSRVRRLYQDTPEGWSASLAEGELLLATGENEAALDSLLQAARSASEAPYYKNQWVPEPVFRIRLQEAYSIWMERGEYALANEYAKNLPPVVSLADAVRMRADAYRLWGESLQREAEQALPVTRSELQAAARKNHRTAAKLYAWLAELRFATAHYPSDVWLSGQQYLAGRDYQSATHELAKYLEVELKERRPEALTSLARAQLALGQLNEAEESIVTVLENYPTHPETYRARLLGSDIWLERRKIGAPDELAYLTEASRLLEANLNEEALTPRSLEWRDSLFALGNVLALEAAVQETASRSLGVDLQDDPESAKVGLRQLAKAHETYQVAIRRLEEVILRYPDAPAANLARYRLAEANRNSAKYPRKKLPTVLIQSTRVQLQREMDEQLNAAYKHYKSLQQRLNKQQEHEELTPAESAMLRNCYFGCADVLFDARLYEDAIREYSTASNRYQSEPAALEAFVQIASAYRELGRPYEARGTLEQAKVVLHRIRDDARFEQTTRFDRGQWERLLDLLSAL